MENKYVVLKAFDNYIKVENIEKISENHNYISDKLILDLVNGVNVVARDHHNILKNRSGFSGVFGVITGSSKKYQDLINENIIEGLNSCTYWLKNHDKHFSRIDRKIEFFAKELYNTREEILKFYSQHTNLKNRVGELENSFENFVSISKSLFDNFEDRIKNLEIGTTIYKEISFLKSNKKYSNYESLPLKIYALLDNLFSGELGLYCYSNQPKKDENIEYLKSELSNLVGSNYKKEILDFDEICKSINKLDNLDKNAISYISTQQYNSIKNNKQHPEICDLISLASSFDTFEESKKQISKQPSISEFITYDDFIEIAINEQIMF
ncbi:hypothetical protein [Aliarcobacter butzleri]|uniref:hypothetical protein n=1 Tax=Aliarcobacter butzleri TaxID=28197 RepID=UPI001EDB289B|nr:hypothetical protein [Aliarcobacter butzleri]MCG3688800.1 hypothetical protein [Aliarcobacter butzleri]